MRCFLIVFVLKVLLNFLNFLVYSLLVFDKLINVEFFLLDIWMLYLIIFFCYGSFFG